MKITEEIFQVGGPGLTSQDDAAIYLIWMEGRGAIVDAGCGRSHARLMKNINKRGVGPEGIECLLITHCHFDHTGGAEQIRNELKCSIIAHEMDACYLEQGDSTVSAADWYGAELHPLKIDVKLSGPETNIRIGERVIKAVHTPGHSPGSVVYLMESEGFKVLFGQDVHGPLDPAFKSDRKKYMESLERLISLDADILCEGHYGVFKGKREVKDFIGSFL